MFQKVRRLQFFSTEIKIANPDTKTYWDIMRILPGIQDHPHAIIQEIAGS